MDNNLFEIALWILFTFSIIYESADSLIFLQVSKERQLLLAKIKKNIDEFKFSSCRKYPDREEFLTKFNRLINNLEVFGVLCSNRRYLKNNFVFLRESLMDFNLLYEEIRRVKDENLRGAIFHEQFNLFKNNIAKGFDCKNSKKLDNYKDLIDETSKHDVYLMAKYDLKEVDGELV